jgi:DNA-binding NtrC family response regulator
MPAMTQKGSTMFPSPDARPAVLVVDDDDGVRSFMAGALRLAGFDVCEAANGRAACRAVAERGGTIGLAVLDIQMPELDGPGTLAALRTLCPGLPCVFVTGFSGNYTEEDLLAGGAAEIISKPFRPSRLAEAVGQALRSRVTA